MRLTTPGRERSRVLRTEKPSIVFFASLLLGAAGAALIWYSTQWGAGLMDDSFIYITSAKNLVAGRGLAWPWGSGELLPMTYFPPMLPLTLAAFEVVGVDAIAAIRMINLLAFGANVVLVGLIARYAARSRGFALFAALLFLASDVLIEAHAWALSEPLYLLFALFGLLLLNRYLHRGSRWGLFGSALLLGLAFLTRYIGFSLILVGLIVLVIASRATWRRRFWDIALFSFVSLLPMAGWMLRNSLVIGGAIDRTPGAYLVTWNQIRNGLQTIFTWFLPGRIVQGREFLLLAVLVIAVATGILWVSLSRRGRVQDRLFSNPAATMRLILALQVIVHPAVLLVSKSFFEPTTPLNDRILSPILPSLLILLASLLADVSRMRRVALRAAALVVALLFTGFYVARSASLVPRLHDTGLGLARRGWRNSETLEAVRELPQVPLFTNSPAAIYLYTGRPAYPIYNIEFMRQSMQEDDAALVLFTSVDVGLYSVSEADLVQGLTRTHDSRDGAIYQWVEP